MNFRALIPPVVLPLVVLLAGCGGSDRTALARQTVQNYWYDVGHVQPNKAYQYLSPGDQGQLTRAAFSQNIYGFLRSTSGVTAKVGKITLIGDCALVPVGLIAAVLPGGVEHVYQDLWWYHGHWVITNPNGQATKSKTLTCPTGS